CDHDSSFLSAASRAARSALLCRKLWAQIGARATVTASLDRRAASVSAFPPVTHPPQLNPTMANVMAPPTAPQRAGFVSAGIFMAAPFDELENFSDPPSPIRHIPGLVCAP